MSQTLLNSWKPKSVYNNGSAHCGVSTTLNFLAPKRSETPISPPSNVSKWHGLRGLVVQLEEVPVHLEARAEVADVRRGPELQHDVRVPLRREEEHLPPQPKMIKGGNIEPKSANERLLSKKCLTHWFVECFMY